MAAKFAVNLGPDPDLDHDLDPGSDPDPRRPEVAHLQPPSIARRGIHFDTRSADARLTSERLDHGSDLAPCDPPGFVAMIGGPCWPGTTFSATAWATAGLVSPRAFPPPSPAGTVVSTRSSPPLWTFRSHAADWLRSRFAESRFSVLTLCCFVSLVISKLASFGAFSGVFAPPATTSETCGTEGRRSAPPPATLSLTSCS